MPDDPDAARVDDETAEPLTDADDPAIDALPYEEARGPHLPDAVTAIPWLAWVFVLLAVADFLWIYEHTVFGPGPDLGTVLSFATGLTWSVAACLMPAALLVRHRDAPTRAPLLLLGTILFAVVQGLQILGTLLEPMFEQLTPASDDLPFLVPAAEAYRQAGFLLAAVGLAFIGLGLARARRYEDRRSIVALLLVPVAILLAALTILDAIQQIVLGDYAVTATYSVYLGVAILVAILRILAWAYLTAMATRGSAAGEDPGTGWRLAALGGGLVLVSLAVSTVLSVVLAALDVRDNSLLWVAYAYSGTFALGHLCLLAGLAFGLPALEPLEALEDEPDEADAIAPEDEDDLGWPVAGVPGR